MVLESVPGGDEYNDFERHDLLTGEPRYVEDEIRNTQFTKIFGVLALLFATVSLILVWVLAYRERSRTFIWHGIFMAITVLFLLITIVWGFLATTAMKTGRQPNPIFSGFIHIFAIALIGYLLVESVWLILYRKIHFDYLVGYSTDQDAWNNRMPNGKDFNYVWSQDRKMIWWTVFFNLATAVMLGFIAYFARSVSWNRYQLARATLYVALVFMALAGWLMIYWVEEAYEYRRAIPGSFQHRLLEVTKAWGIIAIVFAGVNAFVNFFQHKIGYFIMALLDVALIIAMVLTVGVFLRNVRLAEFSGLFPGGCSSTQYSIHESSLDDRWCPVGGKYLPPGQTCRKSDMVLRWEGSNEVRSLNPGCCSSSNFYYLYPFMLVGFWTLVGIASTAVAAGNNLYIADTNEYLSSTNRVRGLLDFVGLGAVLAMIIAWGIYFLARKQNQLDYALNPNIAAFNDPFSNRLAGFDLVPDAIKVNSNNTTPSALNDGCIGFNNSGSAYPSFDTSGACSDPNTCVLRLAMLFKDSTVRFANNGGAVQGSTTNRELFFPGCTGTLNDYIFYYGTQAQLKTLLDNLRICPRATGASTSTFFMYADQVARANMGADGQLTTEPPIANVITAVDAPTCGNGYAAATTCVGNCKISRTVNQFSDTAPMKGQLYYVQNGQRNFNIHNLVGITAYNRNDPIGGPSTLYAGGIFTILNIPRYSSNNYIATIDINDAAGVFLQKKVDVLVPLAGSANTEISAGFTRLDTKDGNVCAQTDTVCIANQRLQLGSIQGSVRDGTGAYASDSSPMLSDASVTLIRWHQVAGQTFGSQITGSAGSFSFTGIPFDAYSLQVNRTGFRPQLTFIDLQTSSLTVPPIVLRPLVDAYDMRVVAEINEPNVDFDLNLLVLSDTGANCTVSPLNKYCAYSGHFNDVTQGAGEEDILIKKLAVATYMPWLAPSPPYAANCPAGDIASNNARLFHGQGWNWEIFKQTRPLSRLNIDTKCLGKSVEFNPSIFQSLLSMLHFEESVETDEEARKLKKVLNRNGHPVIGDIFEDTFFGEGSHTVPPVQFIPSTNGTVTGNSTTNFTVGNCAGTLSTLQYTNSTTQNFVNVTRTVNSTICPNGTNFTEVNTSSSYWGFDKQRAELLNRTFTTAYSNGTSRVERNNTKFSFPNATFDLSRNHSNNSIITGVNPDVTQVSYAINKANTNHSYNESILETYNSAASSQSNTTVSSIKEINFYNSTVDQNFSRTFNFVYVPIAATNSSAPGRSGSGSQNTTSFLVMPAGNLTEQENCLLGLLANGSTTINCSVSESIVYSNGTTATSNSTKNDLLTTDVNAGANIVKHGLAVAHVANASSVYNRTENLSRVQLPNGTNSSLSVISENSTSNASVAELYNYDWDVNDVNSTNNTILSSSDYRNNSNGSGQMITLFVNRTTTPNASNTTTRSFSNMTTNGTGQANSSYQEASINNATTNGSNVSVFMSNWTRNAPNSSGLANFSINNFTSEIDSGVDTYERVTHNDSIHWYTNGSNSSYNVATNVSAQANGTNSSVGNLSIIFNFSANSSSQYKHDYNVTETANNSSMPNATLTWNNESRVEHNVSGNNESFSNVSFNVSQQIPVNNSNASLVYVQNFTGNVSQNLSYSNNTTINASHNISNKKSAHNQSSYNASNLTTRNYSLMTVGGDNSSWSLENASNLSTEGGNNTTLWIQHNQSLFAPSADSSVNKTNSSLYNFSSTASLNNGSNQNISNLSMNLSIGSNASNATVINSSLYWNNRSEANGSQYWTGIEKRDLRSPDGTGWRNVSFFNNSNYSLNAPNTTNVSQNVSSVNSCTAVNSTLLHSNNCNFTYNYTNGTNDSNASVNNTSQAINRTNYTNGSNYSYLLEVNNSSTLNGTAPRVNVTHFKLNESFVHPPMSNGSVFANTSVFLECLVVQNFTGYYSNCSNDSLAILGQNASFLVNLSNVTETNVTYILVNTTNTTNYSLDLLQINTTNGSISDSIDLYANLTAPVTVNSTQINLTNMSNYSRHFEQNRSDFNHSFSEYNNSKNVGVSLDHAAVEANNAKNDTLALFLAGNSSTSTRNETIVNQWHNLTADYRYNDSNKSYFNSYTHLFSDKFSPNSTLNQSNTTRNYGSTRNSSLLKDVSVIEFYSLINTGYNESAVFDSNMTAGIRTVQINYPNASSSPPVYLNNSSLVQNTSLLIVNASGADANNFTLTSSLGHNGFNYSYGNWSLNQSEAVLSSGNLFGFNTLNWTLNNLTGTFTNGSGNLGFRKYNYELFNKSVLVNFTSGGPGLAVEKTYNFSVYDSINLTGGTNSTLNESHFIFNSTDVPSQNTTQNLHDLVLCQANGTCIETYYQNTSVNDSAPAGMNTSVSANFTKVYQNVSSNVSAYNSGLLSTIVSSSLNLTISNYTSNLTLGNGSNVSQFNWTRDSNSSNSTTLLSSLQTSDSYLFLSPRLTNGSASGLIRNYTSNSSRVFTNLSSVVHHSSLKIDNIELVGGVRSLHYNSTNSSYVSSSSQDFNRSAQVNISRVMPAPPVNTPTADYNNSTQAVVFADNATVRYANTTTDLSGFEAASGDTSFGYLACMINSTKASTYYKNDSNVSLLHLTTACIMLNGSVEVNSTVKFLKVDQVSTAPSTSGNQNFTRTVDSVLVANTTSLATSRRRMLLQEPMAAHAQGSGNYIFIGCFTGFGTASLININQIVDNAPTINTCLTRLSNERPNYTVTKLRQAYKDYYAQNPNAS
jgi:hypothetical protein